MIGLAALKAALQIPEGYTEHDEYLAGLERAAIAYVQRKTGWYWGSAEDVTVHLRGMGSPDLWLPDHASDVGEVVQWSPYGVDQTIDASEYALRLEPGSTHGIRLVRRSGIWHPGVEYAVTYTRGYAEGAEPEDIRQAVTALVALWYEQRLPVSLGMAAAPVPDHVAAILAAHRRVMV